MFHASISLHSHSLSFQSLILELRVDQAPVSVRMNVFTISGLVANTNYYYIMLVM